MRRVPSKHRPFMEDIDLNSGMIKNSNSNAFDSDLRNSD